MRVLKILRMVVLLVGVLAAIFFTVKNPNERVRIDLILFPVREGVLLVEILFYTLLLGAVMGFSVALVKIVELQAQLRLERKSRSRLEGELTTLRNLPLEDVGEVETESGVVP